MCNDECKLKKGICEKIRLFEKESVKSLDQSKSQDML